MPSSRLLEGLSERDKKLILAEAQKLNYAEKASYVRKGKRPLTCF